jgi:hypothetical protein
LAPEALTPRLPSAWITTEVRTGEDYRPIRFRDVEERIGKAPEWRAANIATNGRKLLGGISDRGEHCAHRRQEFAAQSAAVGVIPLDSLYKVRCRFLAKQ